MVNMDAAELARIIAEYLESRDDIGQATSNVDEAMGTTDVSVVTQGSQVFNISIQPEV